MKGCTDRCGPRARLAACETKTENAADNAVENAANDANAATAVDTLDAAGNGFPTPMKRSRTW